MLENRFLFVAFPSRDKAVPSLLLRNFLTNRFISNQVPLPIPRLRSAVDAIPSNMAPFTIVDSLKNVQSSRSFLDLPPEIRNQIYGTVYNEVTIYCTFEVDLQSLLGECGATRTNRVTPNLNLLLTCRKTYIEAEPFLDSAPIIVTGEFGGRANLRNFPRHVLRRARDLTLHDDIFFRLTEASKAFGFNFLDRQIYPNLRLIKREAEKKPLEVETPSLGFEDGMLG